VVPIAVGILLRSSPSSRAATAAVGRLFGPVTMLWFIVIGAAGVHGIVQAPAILGALNPLHAFFFSPATVRRRSWCSAQWCSR